MKTPKSDFSRDEGSKFSIEKEMINRVQPQPIPGNSSTESEDISLINLKQNPNFSPSSLQQKDPEILK